MLHVDGTVEVQLTVKKELDELKEYRITTLAEFDEKEVRKYIRPYVMSVPFFDVSKAEIRWAGEVIDKWILDHYKDRPTILEAYEKFDKWPDGIDKELPKLLMPAYDVFVKLNQNRACSCYILKTHLPEFPDLDVSSFSGFKVINAGTTEMNTYYNILKLRGKYNQIDAFSKRFAPKNYI